MYVYNLACVHVCVCACVCVCLRVYMSGWLKVICVQGCGEGRAEELSVQEVHC
jgi:hypothetical protein